MCVCRLTLQLTDLKTEEEERLAEERKKSEEKKEKEEEEKRVYEVLESQRVQLDELTAAVAESFELKCHLQELGKSYSQTRDQLQVHSAHVSLSMCIYPYIDVCVSICIGTPASMCLELDICTRTGEQQELFLRRQQSSV